MVANQRCGVRSHLILPLVMRSIKSLLHGMQTFICTNLYTSGATGTMMKRVNRERKRTEKHLHRLNVPINSSGYLLHLIDFLSNPLFLCAFYYSK